MNCLKCRKTELQEQKADLTAEVKGETVLVTQFPALVCLSCGYKTIRGHAMQDYMRAAADVYRAKHGLLTSIQIRESRESLNQTQDEFARYLDVGIASVKRWELGQIQDRAMDRLIRLSTDPAEAYHNFKKVEQLVAPTHFWVPTMPQTWEAGESIKWQKMNNARKPRQHAACS
jgi:putative zinc finger/helix-turn-helix YgiT family protein